MNSGSARRIISAVVAALLWLMPEVAWGLATHQDFPPSTSSISALNSPAYYLGRSSPIHSTNLLQSPFLLAQEPSLRIPEKQFQSDTVVRILDANTVKLEKSGLVSLAGAQTPSIGGFPECSATSPSKQLRKSLPKNAKVKVKLLAKDGESANVARALILRDDNILVNAEVVESGFAKPVARGRMAAEEILPGFTEELNRLNQQAKANRVGLYQLCTTESGSASTSSSISALSTSTTESSRLASFPSNLDDQFEPLDVTTQTQWTSDGGKTILVEKGVDAIPANPGDIKGCSDFETYEDALRWFETYQPYYGDVANLDRDGDGVPCPKLPHTKNMERFRRKVPASRVGGGAVVEVSPAMD